MKKLTFWLFCISVLLTEVGFFLKNEFIVSIFNNLTSFFIIGLLILLSPRFDMKDVIKFLTTLFIYLFCFFIKFANSPTFDVRDAMYMFVVLMTLILVPKLELLSSDLKLIKYGFYLISLIYFIGSFDANNLGFYPSNYLMFGYSNPNVLSSVLLTHIVFICLPLGKNSLLKIIDIIMIVFNLYMINMTGSRTVMVSGLLMLVFRLFHKQVSKGTTIFIAYLSIFFPILIIVIKQFINNIAVVIDKLFESSKVTTLNGRDRIWMNQLGTLIHDASVFFIGMKPTSDYMLSRNSHNYLLYILYFHGIIIFINYIVLLLLAIKNKISNLKGVINKLTVFSWFIIIISNTFESFLSTGLISFSILWLLLLCKYSDDEQVNNLQEIGYESKNK